MGRMTVTLDDHIEGWLREIQGTLIVDTKQDWSFTTIVNMVLLVGFLGVEKLGEKQWAIINSFLEQEKPKLELESPVDAMINRLHKARGAEKPHVTEE